MWEVGDELAVEIGEAHEGLYLFLGHGHWPLHNSRNFDRVHLNTVVGDDDTEVLDTHLLELTLVVSQVELVFMHVFHDYPADVAMLLQGIREDEDIVQVDNNHSLQDEVMEDLIHHRLEGCGAVCQAEVHYEGFKQATIRVKGCLPFVALLDADIVVSPVDVQLCKVSCSLEAVDQIIYKG